MEESACYGQTDTACILLFGGNKQCLLCDRLLDFFRPFPEKKVKSFKKLSDWIFAVTDLAVFSFFKSKAFFLSLLTPCTHFITVSVIYGQCCSFFY